jgi:hypothetical protein
MPGVAGGYAPYGATGVIPGYSYGVTPGVGFGAAPTVGITGMPAIGVPGVVTPGITGTPGFGMGGGLPANNPYGLPEGFNPAWLQDPSLQQYFRPLSEQIPRNRWIYSANGILFACEMAKRGVIVPWVR